MSEETVITPGRIVNLSDGVFSIVMTLLVLDIKIPSASQVSSSAELIRHLYQLLPKFQYYFITFIVIGIFWVGHHYQFHFIKKSDNKLIWMNIFFLMLLHFYPSPHICSVNTHTSGSQQSFMLSTCLSAAC